MTRGERIIGDLGLGNHDVGDRPVVRLVGNSRTTQSDYVIYCLLEARSEILWGEQVHRFFQVVGVVLMVLGMLWALGAIW